MASEPLEPEFSQNGRFSTKATRIQEAKQTQEKLPESYRFNTHKEELCLKYADNFVNQLASIFPDREPGIVAPLNECGVPKLICTTLRPTQLPYRELYDAEKCADFISSFINYEPLEHPTSLPSTIPSPTLTLYDQTGDSFDMATVLCSYLLGAGYDAYCVYGYAPREVTLHDTSETKCYLPENAPLCFRERVPKKDDQKELGDNGEEAPDAEGPGDEGKVSEEGESKGADKGDELGNTNEEGAGEAKVDAVDAEQTELSGDAVAEEAETIVDIVAEVTPSGGGQVEHEDPYFIPEEKVEASKYEVEVSERANRKKTEMDSAIQQEMILAAEKENAAQRKEDPIANQRIHCWVLVRAGKRMVEESFFLEPSTGAAFSIDDCPYLGVNSMWNNSNYWFNVGSLHDHPSKLSFNLTNTTQWEYIFFDSQLQGVEGKEDSDDGDSDLEEEEAGNGGDALEDDNVLDLPPSWVKQLHIPRESYRRKYGLTGQKVELLCKAKRELYAPYIHPQGIVARYFFFSDEKRTITESVHEYFSNRRDKLTKRVRLPQIGKVIETFSEGRMSGLKQLTEVAGKRRIFEFYAAARLDGLIRREEELGRKVVEIFTDRDDLLIWRSVTVASPNIEGKGPDGIRTSREDSGSKGALVLPMGQLGDLEIVKMTEKFLCPAGKSADSCIAKRTFFVHNGSIRVLYHYVKGRVTRSSRIFYKDRSTPPEVSVVDDFAPPVRPSQVEAEFQTALQAEKDCYQSARDSEREAQDMVALRRREEQTIVLEKSVFENAQERSKEDVLQDKSSEEKVEKDGRQVDYLTLFLPNGSATPMPLTRDDAEAAREACLRALKERLLERANIIQRRLDEENMQLAKKQAAFQRSRDHVEGADEEFELFCSEAMFRIQILEQRLTRHEETALQKYAEMDHKLRHDPRLTNLQ